MKRRLLVGGFLFSIAFWFCATAEAQTTAMVFLVRHGETVVAAAGDKNPALSEAGHARAERLAKTLRDAGIAAVFATEYRRTQETAAPVARMAGVEVTVLPARDAALSLAAKWKDGTLPGNVLVVGHSNTLPEIIAALGISAPVKIEESEHDGLLVLVPGADPRLIRLRY